MRALIYITNNIAELDEAVTILNDECSLVARYLHEPIQQTSLSPQERLCARVAAGYAAFGQPVFATSATIYTTKEALYDPSLALVSEPPADIDEFCRIHGGKKGVLSHQLAYCDGGDPMIFSRDSPGTISESPQGFSHDAFDCIWIPNGYSRPFADLQHFKHIINKRVRLLFDLAAHLGCALPNHLYEAHITVDCQDGLTFDDFQKACTHLGVKAIQIQLPSGKWPTHLITASFHYGTVATVKQEVGHIAEELEARGFSITRMKIESLLKNPEVPVVDEDAQKRKDSQYFEFHVKLCINADTDLDSLAKVTQEFGGHFSRNASNSLSDNSLLQFATLRVYRQGRTSAEAHFERFLSELRQQGYELSNILREYTVFDTNATLDDGWFRTDTRPYCFQHCEPLALGECPFTERADPITRFTGLQHIGGVR